MTNEYSIYVNNYLLSFFAINIYSIIHESGLIFTTKVKNSKYFKQN